MIEYIPIVHIFLISSYLYALNYDFFEKHYFNRLETNSRKPMCTYFSAPQLRAMNPIVAAK